MPANDCRSGRNDLRIAHVSHALYLTRSQLNLGVWPQPNISQLSPCRMHRPLAIASIVVLLATSVEGQRASARASERGGALYAPAADVTISLLTVGVGSQ